MKTLDAGNAHAQVTGMIAGKSVRKAVPANSPATSFVCPTASRKFISRFLNRKRALAFLFLCISMTSNLWGQGQMVYQGRISLGTGGWMPYDYSLNVINTADGQGSTTIWVNRRTSSIAYMDTLVDEASGWYFAHLNDVFTTESWEAGSFTVFGGHPNYSPSPYFNVGYYNPFYLAVASGSGIWSPSVEETYWTGPVFGWGLFQNTPSGLQLLDSAVAYGSQGIVVGTMTAVPAPSSVALLVFGGVSLIFVRRLR